MDSKLRDLKSHFAFGKNWKDYADHVSQQNITHAQSSMEKLIQPTWIKGKTFLDLGCGSGIHSIAAHRMGASEINAVDIDPNSVATTKKIFQRFEIANKAKAEVASVFDLETALGNKKFDVVYSWGVLHHTGDMMSAIRRAGDRVIDGGHLVIALYYRTKFCSFWRIEKRLYKDLPRPIQLGIQHGFTTAFRLGKHLKAFRKGERFDFRKYVNEYYKTRGMRFSHDVHDWLGGYPYESISSAEVTRFMRTLGFKLAFENGVSGEPWGLAGSGCNEYAFRKEN